MASIMSDNCAVRRPDRFFIGGEWVVPSSGSQFSITTPSTEQLYMRFAEAQSADVNRAVTAAREAFDHGPWPLMSHADRAGYLYAAADVFERRAAELSRIWTSQMGILLTHARGMVDSLPGALRYYAGLATTFPFIEPHECQDAARRGFIVREPVGVAALIIPWNSPIYQVIYKSAPALLAGCTVIVKSSPETPGESYVMAEIMEEIGLPKGVFNTITADREVSEQLVRHPGIDKVSFTGSTAAGKKIAGICADRIARCTLELGGKSAAVVLDDYDVGKVADVIATSTCFISNQVCSALSRIVIPRQSHDRMVDALSAAFDAIRVGDPFAADTQIGPLAMSRQRDRVESYIARGVAEGATLATGGHRPSHLDRGYYIEPTVFGNADPSSAICQEEIFGPVVTIIPAENEDHAIDIANGTPYGLNSSVFTNDVERAYRVGRRLRAGTVGQNSFQTDFKVAFGGFKQSGSGREGGLEGLMPYLETKTMILDSTPGFETTPARV